MRDLMDDVVNPVLGPVVCVVGARPNFIKMAPILRAMRQGLDMAYRQRRAG